VWFAAGTSAFSLLGHLLARSWQYGYVKERRWSVMKVRSSWVVVALGVLVLLLCSRVHARPMVRVLHKDVSYHMETGLCLLIEGEDAEGNPRIEEKVIPKEKCFPSALFHRGPLPHVYRTALLLRQGPVCYVVGYVLFEVVPFKEHYELRFSPSFLMNWGYDKKRQRIYISPDTASLPRAPRVVTEPLKEKTVREKIMFDELHEAP